MISVTISHLSSNIFFVTYDYLYFGLNTAIDKKVTNTISKHVALSSYVVLLYHCPRLGGGFVMLTCLTAPHYVCKCRSQVRNL